MYIYSYPQKGERNKTFGSLEGSSYLALVTILHLPHLCYPVLPANFIYTSNVRVILNALRARMMEAKERFLEWRLLIHTPPHPHSAIRKCDVYKVTLLFELPHGSCSPDRSWTCGVGVNWHQEAAFRKKKGRLESPHLLLIWATPVIHLLVRTRRTSTFSNHR